MLYLQALLLFLAGILNIIVGAIALLRDNKFNNVSFFGFAVGVGCWTFSIAAFLLSNERNIAFFWAKAFYFFPLLLACSLVLFVRTFPRQRPTVNLWTGVAIGGFLLLTPLLLFSHNFVTEGLVYHEWGKEVVLNKPQYLLYSVYLLFCFISSLVYMYLQSRRLKGYYKSQASLFFAGFLITAIFADLFNLIFPWLGNYQLIWLGPLFTSFWVIFVAYSIVKHHMFDVRFVIARSLAYIISLGIITASYTFLTYIVTVSLTRNQSSTTQNIVNLGLLMFFVVSYAPLKERFDRLTSNFFYRDAYDPQEFLDRLNAVLVNNNEVHALLRKSSAIIAKYLKLEYAAISVYSSSSETFSIEGLASKDLTKAEVTHLQEILAGMHVRKVVTDELSDNHIELKDELMRRNIAIINRLTADTTGMPQQTVIYLILGTKKSGGPFTGQDNRIVDIISDELEIAIQNAIHYKEIKEFSITLQERINDATRKLRQSNTKLKTLDETKDDFISMASHQLRTPLTSMKGYISMVLEGDAGQVTPLQEKMLQQAFISSQRMAYLISDLLNLSRLKTGKFVIDRTKIDLAKVVEEEVSQLRDTAKMRNLKINYKKPDNFPALELDDTKTRQVIMNFLDNAIYYTKDNGEIEVNLKDKPSAIELTITDDGIGVPKSEQHHLFTKFYRAANAKRARPDGTGLGLFMAKKVIIAQGGAVIFRSQEGKGSTFGFSFPKEKLAA